MIAAVHIRASEHASEKLLLDTVARFAYMSWMAATLMQETCVGLEA